jgi:excisionase family DNA binding protein
MPGDLLNTREVAEHLGINEKQVYALIKAKRIPATRITGKWMFPRRLLEDWIEADARRTLAGARERTRRLDRALLAAGSDDPVLTLLSGELRKGDPGVLLFLASTGSTEGLRALDRGDIDVAFSHLHDPATGEYNLPFLPELVSGRPVAAVNLFHREIGLVVPGDGTGRVRDVGDLRAPGVRLVNRQPGSGTRALLEQELAKAGVDAAAIEGWDREVSTHHEVALAVKSGEADVGVATLSVARLFGLQFVPLREERFDMVVDRAVFFERRFQALVDRLVSGPFRERACRIGGYDFRSCGSVLTRDP